MITIIGSVNPVFAAAGAFKYLANALPDPVGPAISLNKAEVSVHKAIANVPPEILQKYTVSQADKGVGPVIMSNRWLDTMKVKTICGSGFEIMGVSTSQNSTGSWSLNASSDTEITLENLIVQTTEAFLCAIDSAVDIAPTDRLRVLREIVSPSPHQLDLGYFSGLPKVLKNPAALRPNVDMSDTFTEVACKIANAGLQIIAKEFRKLHNELDDYVTAEITESFDFGCQRASANSIQRMLMRLDKIQETGVDLRTVRICPADIKEMFTEMNYTSSIEDVKYICTLLHWDLKTPLQVEYKTTVPVGNNPNTGKPLVRTQRCKATVTIAEVLHIINCVCQHGIYICNCTTEAYLVRTISSLIMGVSFSPNLASLSGTANRVRLIMDVRNKTAPVFCVGCLEKLGTAHRIHSNRSIHTRTVNCGLDSFRNESLHLICPFYDEKQLYYSARYIDDLGEILFGDTERMKQYLRAYYLHKMGLDILFSDPIAQTPYCGQASDIAASGGESHIPWLNIAIQSELEIISAVTRTFTTKGTFYDEKQVATIKFVPYTKPGTNHGVKDGRSYMPDSTRNSIVIGQMIAGNAVTQESNPESQAKEKQFRLGKLCYQGYDPAYVKHALQSWAKSKSEENNPAIWKRPEDYKREAQIIVDYHDNIPSSLIRNTALNKLGFNIRVGTRSGLPIGAKLTAMTRNAVPEHKARSRSRTVPDITQLQKLTHVVNDSNSLHKTTRFKNNSDFRLHTARYGNFHR